MNGVKRALLALLVAAVAGTASAGPLEISREFFLAYAAGDAARAAKFWKRGEAERFRRNAERTAAVRCFIVRDLDVRIVESKPERARVELDASAMTWSAAGEAVPVERRMLKSIELEPEGESWKIVAFRDREEALADEIAAAPPDRRAAMAQSTTMATTMRTPMLASQLARRAVRMINQKRLADSTQLLALAEEIAAESGDGAAIADVMAIRGTWLRTGPRRDLAASLEVGERSVEWATMAGSPDVIAHALQRLGRTRNILIEKIDEPVFARIIALADQLEDVTPVAAAYSELSSAASFRDDARESLRYSILTARYAEETTDAAIRFTAALVLGAAFWKHGDFELARVHLERSIAIAREAGFVQPLAGALNYLARVQLSLGDERQFLKTIEEGLALGDVAASSELLLTRAKYYVRTGDLAAATADLDRVENETEITLAQRRNAVAAVRAHVLLKQGRCEEALQAAMLPCRYNEGCGPTIERAHALECLGRKDEAVSVALQVLDDEERQRSTASAAPQQLGSWQEEHASIYESVAELLLDQKRTAEALIVAGRVKARILEDARDELLLNPGRLGGADRAAYEQLNGRIQTLNRRFFEKTSRGEIDAALREELDRARREMRELLAQTDPALRGAPSRATGAVHEETVAAPPAGVVVIEYLTAETRTLAFAVTRSARGEAVVTAHSIPIARAELKQRVARHLAATEQRDLRSGESARALYDLLLAPFEPLLHGHRALCVVPAGDLWSVPFHALRTRDGRYLVETTEVFYAPSLGALETMRAARGAGDRATLLALANPNLRAKTQDQSRAYSGGQPLGAIPETEREVRALVPIYGPEHSGVYVGDAAQEAVVKRESPKFTVLHIAAHGILDENAPWFSALALSTADDREDGLLEAREIAELPLRADLAVLSACDTGRGRATAGEGIIGLSWALLAAGCPNAVVSQWRADSATTTELMIAFHRDLVRTGRRSPAESLRRAQLSLMRRHPHPYYWAPFIVVGRGQ